MTEWRFSVLYHIVKVFALVFCWVWRQDLVMTWDDWELFLCLNKRIDGTAESAEHRSKMVCKKLWMLFGFILSGSATIQNLVLKMFAFLLCFFYYFFFYFWHSCSGLMKLFTSLSFLLFLKYLQLTFQTFLWKALPQFLVSVFTYCFKDSSSIWLFQSRQCRRWENYKCQGLLWNWRFFSFSFVFQKTPEQLHTLDGWFELF